MTTIRTTTTSDYGIHEVSCSILCIALAVKLTVQVWADNLETEFAALRLAIEQYPYVSMVSSHTTFWSQ